MSYLSVLDHSPNMLSVVQKIPQYLQNKWLDNVGITRRNSNHGMKFSDLVDFISLILPMILCMAKSLQPQVLYRVVRRTNGSKSTKPNVKTGQRVQMLLSILV